ncbi:MAG: glycerol-3-phosphate acyltransferase [Clostridia bacterium]|nr:glycerol-3-phosphate acyltransferase [Clostridia bacterium]
MFAKLITSGVFGMMNSGAAYIAGIVACAVISYLVGSFNFMAGAAKKANCFPDLVGLIKAIGVWRAIGLAALDALKGALCALLGLLLMPGDGYVGVCGLFCMIGQIFPLYSKFKGGGAGAVAVGVCLVMNPIMALACLAVGFAMYAVSGFISLGVITFSCVFPFLARRLPLFTFVAEETRISLVNAFLENLVPIALAIAVLLAYASAIGRMMAGDEPKMPLFKKKTQINL